MNSKRKWFGIILAWMITIDSIAEMSPEITSSIDSVRREEILRIVAPMIDVDQYNVFGVTSGGEKTADRNNWYQMEEVFLVGKGMKSNDVVCVKYRMNSDGPLLTRLSKGFVARYQDDDDGILLPRHSGRIVVSSQGNVEELVVTNIVYNHENIEVHIIELGPSYTQEEIEDILRNPRKHLFPDSKENEPVLDDDEDIK